MTGEKGLLIICPNLIFYLRRLLNCEEIPNVDFFWEQLQGKAQLEQDKNIYGSSAIQNIMTVCFVAINNLWISNISWKFCISCFVFLAFFRFNMQRVLLLPAYENCIPVLALTFHVPKYTSIILSYLAPCI